MAKAKQLSVWLEDRPGILGEVAVALGGKDVNILAFVVSTVGSHGAVRMVVDRPEEAKKVFAEKNWKATEEELIGVTLPDQPGSLGSIARKLGDAGINIHYAYTGWTEGSPRAKTYLAVTDVEEALRILH